MSDATLETEADLAAQGARFIAGMDEVGRGALAGPAMVGVVVVDMADVEPLAGLRDSKALRARRREDLIPAIHQWCVGWAVGSAGAEEVDRHGITQALALAGQRALADVLRDQVIDALILDGASNWIGIEYVPWVITKVKADAHCATVAAASVLAKVTRDALMVHLDRDHPVYGWGRNKGYGSAEHLAALRLHGATDWHRRTWRGVSTAT
jgi:ribonuclease HII